ncbi:hypothetical protein G1H11_24465 [Phytoactinopolyspora alkaliphila]|uniref:Uncharacterized protein n=1 Tax=Phytoactinopolyspora alkaliphila TaxID=1783498 RepID=A0A6N9YU38_9ACTN|nr:hypothetical protein [Phytoactinopolyspora alkaliphila]NED98457.1 hypothetical protein [Phytoactinopolyspora alkaliphila]
MTIGHAPVPSLLTERPPEEKFGNDLPRQSRADTPLRQARPEIAPVRSAAPALHQQYEVVYEDAHGYPLLAFSDGQWWDMASVSPRPVSVRFALRRDPSWAGAVVQTVCLWMRSHPHDERSFDLATELALAVGELARQRD